MILVVFALFWFFLCLFVWLVVFSWLVGVFFSVLGFDLGVFLFVCLGFGGEGWGVFVEHLYSLTRTNPSGVLFVPTRKEWLFTGSWTIAVPEVPQWVPGNHLCACSYPCKEAAACFPCTAQVQTHSQAIAAGGLTGSEPTPCFPSLQRDRLSHPRHEV